MEKEKKREKKNDENVSRILREQMERFKKKNDISL